MKRMASLFVSALLAMAVSHAEAAPLVGDFDIANTVGATVQWVTGAGVVVTLGPSTALDFEPDAAAPPDGEADVDGPNFAITTATGDFVPLIGTLGNIRDFTFIAGAGTGAFPEAPLASWQIAGGLTVDLLTVDEIIKFCPGCAPGPGCPGCVGSSSSVFLNLAGTVRFHLAGFEDTIGTWQFTSQGSAGQTFFSFS